MRVNTKCDCILPHGRMHGRESRTQIAPQGAALVVPGSETGRSSKTSGTQSDVVGKMACSICRARDRRLAQPSTPAAYPAPRLGERDGRLDRADAQTAAQSASGLDWRPSDSPRVEAADATSPSALGRYDLPSIAANRAERAPTPAPGNLLSGTERGGEGQLGRPGLDLSVFGRREQGLCVPYPYSVFRLRGEGQRR